MSLWDRKSALQMVVSIDKVINDPATMPATRQILHSSRMRFSLASRSDRTSSEEVFEIGVELCRVCKGDKLFTCSPAEVWSPNCLFSANGEA